MSEHGHAEPTTFLRKYVFSVDHKVIGIQYLITSFLFLLVGFGMMLLMRYQLAIPVPGDDFDPENLGAFRSMIAWIFGENLMPYGFMAPEFYNQLGAMHGTVMIFLGVVPLGVAAFGNYVLPIQIGADDMAFPRMNMMSYWVYLVGGIVMMSAFLAPGGAAQSGWTSYAPLSVAAPPGQTVWLVAMVIIITSSLLGSINFIVTTLIMRAKGMTFGRLPIFCWAQLVTAVLVGLHVGVQGPALGVGAPLGRERLVARLQRRLLGLEAGPTLHQHVHLVPPPPVHQGPSQVVEGLVDHGVHRRVHRADEPAHPPRGAAHHLQAPLQADGGVVQPDLLLRDQRDRLRVLHRRHLQPAQLGRLLRGEHAEGVAECPQHHQREGPVLLDQLDAVALLQLLHRHAPLEERDLLAGAEHGAVGLEADGEGAQGVVVVPDDEVHLPLRYPQGGGGDEGSPGGPIGELVQLRGAGDPRPDLLARAVRGLHPHRALVLLELLHRQPPGLGGGLGQLHAVVLPGLQGGADVQVAVAVDAVGDGRAREGDGEEQGEHRGLRFRRA